MSDASPELNGSQGIEKIKMPDIDTEDIKTAIRETISAIPADKLAAAKKSVSVGLPAGQRSKLMGDNEAREIKRASERRKSTWNNESLLKKIEDLTKRPGK